MFTDRRICVVAALPREIRFLAGRRGMFCATTGMGPANAARALASLIARHRPGVVIGLGFAGSLSASLRPGDLLLVRKIGRHPAPSPYLLSLASRVPAERLLTGAVVHSDHVVWLADEKRAMAARLDREEPACVDMESAAFLETCNEAGVPCLLLRSITDTLGEDLPLDFNLFRGPDGNVRSFPLMFAALSSPQSWKRLRELQKRSRLCAKRMAAFVLDLLPLLAQTELEVR